MDASGLNERGIDRVDVGHDDRTTIKLGLHFYSCYLPSLQTALLALLPLCLHIHFQVKNISLRALSISVLSK